MERNKTFATMPYVNLMNDNGAIQSYGDLWIIWQRLEQQKWMKLIMN